MAHVIMQWHSIPKNSICSAVRCQRISKKRIYSMEWLRDPLGKALAKLLKSSVNTCIYMSTKGVRVSKRLQVARKGQDSELLHLHNHTCVPNSRAMHKTEVFLQVPSKTGTCSAYPLTDKNVKHANRIISHSNS
eukprot:1148350-Pelagomonas_calceolata.AAC.2